MVVANGCKELQSWSEQRRNSESKPCNQSSHVVNVRPVLSRKFVDSMGRCEIQELKRGHFWVDERDPVAFQSQEVS